MTFVYDQPTTSKIVGAFSNAGWAYYMLPGAFAFGGTSGNTPIGYDPAIVGPYLAQIGAGPLTSGGLVLPTAGGTAYGDVDTNATIKAAIANRDFAANFGATATAPAMASSTPMAKPGFLVPAIAIGLGLLLWGRKR